MRFITSLSAITVALLLAAGVAHAGNYADTITLFKNAGDSAAFFPKSYGFAVFPTVGEAGFQAGGKAYSQIIFFEDKRALDEFESGSFEFAAGISAVAVTAGASASAGTAGATSGASGGGKNANTTSGGYQKVMAVFTIAKGGLMYTATVAGQKFTYTPRGGG